MTIEEPGADRTQPQLHHEFDSAYVEGTPPWDIGRPQAPFVRLADTGEVRGRVLDVGCGTGEHALMAAAKGLESTGIDTAPTAIQRAQEKAVQRSLTARFEVWDALDLPALGEQFDTVLDCGLFHILDDHERERYIDSLAAVVPPGGRYHMLCFSDGQPGDWGPRRVTQAEIRTAFSGRWEIETIEPTVIDLTWDPAGALAWHVTATHT
jgi:SAM-dependent methyltransferase